MKIKNLLKAPEILQKAKELNIDLTNLDPQTRVKLKDGCLVFESEKECFVSAKNSEPEYYYLKEGDVIQEGDEVENSKSILGWEKSIFVGEEVDRHSLKYRRKIQKNPTL